MFAPFFLIVVVIRDRTANALMNSIIETCNTLCISVNIQ